MNVLNSIIPSFPPFPTCRIPLVASFIPHLSRRLRGTSLKDLTAETQGRGGGGHIQEKSLRSQNATIEFSIRSFFWAVEKAT